MSVMKRNLVGTDVPEGLRGAALRDLHQRKSRGSVSFYFQPAADDPRRGTFIWCLEPS